MDDLVARFQEHAERNLDAFKQYFMRGHELSKPLRVSIKRFYKIMVDFSWGAASTLHKSTTSKHLPHISRTQSLTCSEMYVKSFSGNPKGNLEALVQKLEKSASNVYETASGETYCRIYGMTVSV